MTVLGEKSSKFIERISREYGLYTLDARAIPSMTDGLKTSQRIALWVLKNKTGELKTISLAGEMISSKLYVHGDKSAADTISYLAAPYLNNYPLVQGEGQFGSRVSPVEGIGAPRYTDVRRSEFAETYLYVDSEILPMVENYDGSRYMPATFLPLVPLVLLNGVRGIATGWATNILPRCLDDVKRAVQEVLTHGEVKSPIVPYYERYDVEVVQDHSNRNKYIIRGKIAIKNTSTVLVSELPPDLTLDAFKEHLIGLEEEGKIKDFVDNSTDRIDIEIKMSRLVLDKHTPDSLIELFRLRSFQTENIVVLGPSGDGVRKYDRVEDMIVDFVQWRLGWYKSRYEHLLGVEQDQTSFWATFVACFPDVATHISEYPDKSSIREAVFAAAKKRSVTPSDKIVDKIIGLPVYRWTEEGRDEAIEKLEKSRSLIEEYEKIICDPDRQRNIYEREINNAEHG